MPSLRIGRKVSAVGYVHLEVEPLLLQLRQLAAVAKLADLGAQGIPESLVVWTGDPAYIERLADLADDFVRIRLLLHELGEDQRRFHGSIDLAVGQRQEQVGIALEMNNLVGPLVGGL